MTGVYDYGYRHYAPQVGRFTTVDPIKDGSNWYAYVNNDPVNFVDPLGLWDFNGDGTATAQPGDTLVALAFQVSGVYANHKLITGYSGRPEELPIGQTVDYSGMTTSIPVNALIVDGSGVTEENVRDQMRAATITFNSQGVPVTFDTTIQRLTDQTTTGQSLLNIDINDPSFQAAAANNPQGTAFGSSQQVGLLGKQGGAISVLYTNSLSGLGGIAWESANTIINTNKTVQYPDIAAHELIHQLGILDQYSDASSLSYGFYNTQAGTTISGNDVSTIKQHIQNEWGTGSGTGLTPTAASPSKESD